MRSTGAMALVFVVVLTACGGTSGSDAIAPAGPGTSATTPPSQDAAPIATAASSSPSLPDAGASSGATEPAAPASSSTTPSALPSTPPSTAADVATDPIGPAWPDDGCSPDDSAAAAADGPAPAIEIRPESAGSPLPDLAVRRVNCRGGWENLRNELPGDRPLLVWFWAPH